MDMSFILLEARKGGGDNDPRIERSDSDRDRSNSPRLVQGLLCWHGGGRIRQTH